MKQAVLISINPKWCELIASGKKTIEVRKTKPNLLPPFKCYIYETKGKIERPRGDEDGYIYQEGSGMVIGEFVCDKIIDWHYIPDPDESSDPGSMAYDVLTVDGEKTGLEYDDFEDYGKGAPLWGWNISDLKIYDKSKPVTDFWRPDKCPYVSKDGCTYPYHCFRAGQIKRCGDPIERPPQRWCYVEELE